MTVAVAAAACSSGGPAAPTTSTTVVEAAAPEPEAHPIELVEVAADAGIDVQQGAFRWEVTPDVGAMMGTGLCWLDFDGDGRLDLYAVNNYAEREARQWEEEGGLPRNSLLRNVGGGRFEDVSEGSGADLAERGMGCLAADLDRDGDTDLFLTGVRRSTLLWNDGDGTFSDGTEAAGIEAFGWRSGAAAADVDGDGWLDLFVAGYADLANPVPGAEGGFPTTYRGLRDLFFLSERGEPGAVTFREVGRELGFEPARADAGLGASFGDLDVDGDLDLVVANDLSPNRLYDNVPWPGGVAADPLGIGFRFEELAARAGVADPNAGMGVALGDIDGDGRDDLLVTNARGQRAAAHASVPEPERVNPAFTATEAFGALRDGTAWGTTFTDLDLDGRLDLVLVNGDLPVESLTDDGEPMQVLLRTGGDADLAFEDLLDVGGSYPLDPWLARASAVADYDDDGDPDLAISTVGGALVLLENRGGPAAHWLRVRLEGPSIGAAVVATLEDGTVLTREVRAGSSYLSTEDPRPLFGLGDAEAVARLEVRWPDGQVSVRDAVEVDREVVVEAPDAAR